MSELLQIDCALPEKLNALWQPRRYKVFHGGRSGGKSWGTARFLAALGATKPLRILCVRELQNSIKESVHQLIEGQIEKLGLQNHYDVQRDTIKGYNGTEFIFLGMKQNPDKVRSYEDVDIAWVEEAATFSRASWNALTPTIRKPPPGGPFGEGAEIIVTFNPMLEEDYTYQRFVVKPRKNSIVVEINYWDNPFLPPNILSEIEQDKAEDYDNYLHTWEGHPKQQLEGAVFADELREARAQKRITHVPYDRTSGCDVVFDLGRSDSTVMWFVQRIGWELHFIDFYENNLKHLDHYVKVMQDRGYTYDSIWLPHDGKNKWLGTKLSVEEQLKAKGYFVRLVPRPRSIADKLNAGRTIFPNSWFDEDKCSDGLQGLRHWRYEVKDRDADGTPRFTDNPLHSDIGDAFCYVGYASQMGRKRDSQGRRRESLRNLLTPDNWLPGGSTGWMGR